MTHRQIAEKSAGSVRRRLETRSDAHGLDSELILTQPLTLGRSVSITIFLYYYYYYYLHLGFTICINRIIFVLHWEILRVK